MRSLESSSLMTGAPTSKRCVMSFSRAGPELLARGFSSVKELRLHARSLFRMPEKSTANACEEEKQIRKPSERVDTWTV